MILQYGNKIPQAQIAADHRVVPQGSERDRSSRRCRSLGNKVGG